MFRNPTTILLPFVLLYCSISPVSAQSPVLEAFFNDFTDTWVRSNPNQAVSAAYFTGEEQNRMEQQLTPQTRAWEHEQAALARSGLDQLAALDHTTFSIGQSLAAEVMQWQLETVIADDAWGDNAFPINQHSGANVSLVNALTVVHPFRNTRDVDNYLIRLATLDERLEEALDETRRRDELGIRAPGFIVRSTINQLQRFMAPAPAANPLTTTVFKKTATMADLSAAQRQDLTDAAATIVAGQIYPVLEQAIQVLEAQLPRTTEDAGLWRFANGAEQYAHQLRRFTTTNLTADEIHEIGLQEVARIETEMDELFAQLGLTEGSLEQRMRALEASLAFPDTDAGRQAIMTRIDAILEDAQARTGTLFDRRPVAQVIARAYPEFRWANAAASYTAPPLDHSRPGVFQFPLRPELLTEFELRTLVYHETVPGHHYQIALTMEDENLPKFMQIRALGGISAASEGWALYAERLAAESDWYAGDIAGHIGQLSKALFRARRLVVDTGLHAKGWTRQQAIDYGIEASEVERYVVNPGQACSYMIGQLKLVELREKMHQALGTAFSIQDYHNLVLRTGIVPLDVLENVVDRYISEQTASR